MPVEHSQLKRFLEELANALDIPKSRYEEAKQRYKAVGDWLGKEESPLAPYEPEIYPQGSFRLGTVVKPLSEADEYDIDLVCEMRLGKNQVSQKKLKDMVGDRIKANETYRRMLDKEEGRRCWTINYADGAQFHMDILPAIPDEEAYRQLLVAHGVPNEQAQKAISITDNTLPNFERLDQDWPRSNPRGYADWFKSRMQVRFDARLRALAESMKADVEDVPEYQVKTPLQRAVQILKRHRDMAFSKDKDDKPISIIISTLAAHAYNNEDDLLESLRSLVDNMSEHIEQRGGQAWVPNPVNPLENFADKWQEHPQREEKFRSWLSTVRADLNAALSHTDTKALGEALTPRFGGHVVNEAISNAGLMAAAVAAPSQAVPHVEIKNPNKPWGKNDQ